MAGALLVVLLAAAASLTGDLGRSKKKIKFTSLLSKSPEINWLSAARLFLFASRDIWFVVGLPVFLSQLGWSEWSVGAFVAVWVIGYGLIQAAVPEILHLLGNETVDGSAARLWAFVLVPVPASLALAMRAGVDRATVLMIGLAVFAVVFAINSAVHSYLVLAYTDKDRVALDVGFYYMANAGGRLLGTLASGIVFQIYGLVGCLWGAAALVLAAAILSLELPKGKAIVLATAGAGESE
jgi:predicted MFS family arabinose efflux permease